jgi:hypothetical protein|tara:strand:- start:564 stop:791 length:228 start_codon:yes stop_codon:yes gene_type:complete
MTPEDLRATYKALFNTDDGQVVLGDLQKRFHIHTLVHAERCCDSAFNDGQRSTVLLIQNLMQDPKPPMQPDNGEQ